MPTEINVTIRFPRKYLESQPESESAILAGFEEFRRALLRDDVLATRPGAFETRIVNQRPILTVAFRIEFGWSDKYERPVRKPMPEEVHVDIEADQVTYASRFVLEQLFDGEPGQYYAVSRDESGLIPL
jgi:hypothetical protein